MTKMMLPAAMLAGVLSVGNGVAMESAADVAFKNRGIVPELALHLAYVCNTYMFYGKIGCSFGKTEVSARKNNGGDIARAINKAVPTLSLGVERAFCGKFSARLEGEYIFKSPYIFLHLSLERNG